MHLTGYELPRGIRSRTLPHVNGLTMHVLEAGFETIGRPCVVLLHGFPELAYSWRKVMIPLAAAGYHVVAPDQRGYGRTTGWDDRYDGDLDSYRLPSLVADVVALVRALGYESIAAVVGHDFGSPVAAYCALLRPDVFASVVLMSAPFAGAPSIQAVRAGAAAFAALALLDPPRKHYNDYYATREADADMRDCPQGIGAFLRAYYHVKSADWAGNAPHELGGFTAEALAEMPTYYVMERDKTMAQTVAPEMPSQAQIDACRWLPDRELAVYAEEFARTGFQGGLQWYRCRAPHYVAELAGYDGKTIDVPSTFIAGKRDWGVYQRPGSLDAMRANCTQLRDVHLLDGAGHWVQPDAVAALLVAFLEMR